MTKQISYNRRIPKLIRDFLESKAYRAKIKLVVMIPAYNEEETIGSVIREIPRDCCEQVKVLVIDDGSTDKTVKEAERAGADKIISFKQNKGLAPAFRAGLETALEMGADIIVNIDADGQYNEKEILKRLSPNPFSTLTLQVNYWAETQKVPDLRCQIGNDAKNLTGNCRISTQFTPDYLQIMG